MLIEGAMTTTITSPALGAGVGLNKGVWVGVRVGVRVGVWDGVRVAVGVGVGVQAVAVKVWAIWVKFASRVA